MPGFTRREVLVGSGAVLLHTATGCDLSPRY